MKLELRDLYKSFGEHQVLKGNQPDSGKRYCCWAVGKKWCRKNNHHTNSDECISGGQG